MFEAAITNLAEWWSSAFFEVTFDGHIRNRTYDAVQSKLAARGLLGEGDILESQDIQDILGVDDETIRSPKSLMKHALMQSGSRDTSAQLFTALCRGLGVPARLVVSLQSVPWQTNVGKPKPTYDRKPKGKGKGKRKAREDHDGDNDEDELEEVDIPGYSLASMSEPNAKENRKAFDGHGQRLDDTVATPKSDKAKGKEKAKPVINLRKTKSKGNTLGGAPTSRISDRLGKA